MTEQAKPIATRAAYGAALCDLGATDSRIVVLDADLSKSTMTAEFAQKYPQRFFNMGIAEANLIGTAAGFAAAGMVPFASTFAVFATGRAYDQIRNSVAYPMLNVKIAATHAGLTVGEDGGSHQALEDLGLMRAIPGMTVISPADAIETQQAVRLAAAYEGPVYIRLGRPAVAQIHDAEYKLSWGKANVLRAGNTVTVCATGYMTALALEAADQLEALGINAEVINVPFIKPLDGETILASAAKTGVVITAEEHSCYNGLGSAVAELLSENLPCRMRRIAVQDSFGESGKPQELLQKYGLTAAAIVTAAQEIVSRL